IYKKIYLEVSDIVERYATKFDYTLVIRFNRDDAESSDNPQEIMQRMNKQVVYFRASDDITDSVLEYLNKTYNRTAAGSAPATGRATATKQQ
ncbi:MAG: OmpH family outer membrane protein, partial [Planctomycetaceae bacterium]